MHYYYGYDSQTGVSKLHGAHKDAAKMLATFTKLEYAVYHCKNMTTGELTNTVNNIVAVLNSFPWEKMVFVFSGYGTPCNDQKENENLQVQLHTQEGKKLAAQNVLDNFTSFKQPKLFLFNLYQNSPREFMPMDLGFLPKKDNMLVACSTSPYKELNGGSLWIEILTNEILTQNKDVTIVLDDVSNRMSELYCSLPLYEAPQFVNMLRRPVNLLAESFLGNL